MLEGTLRDDGKEPENKYRSYGESMNVVLGIDGGGTKTRASIVDGDKGLGYAENGSIKRLRVGAEAAEKHLRAVLKDVFAQAGTGADYGGDSGCGVGDDARRAGVDHGGAEGFWRDALGGSGR